MEWMRPNLAQMYSCVHGYTRKPYKHARTCSTRSTEMLPTEVTTEVAPALPCVATRKHKGEREIFTTFEFISLQILPQLGKTKS